jgi:DNA-binding CsgD family transcriptional regulator
MNLMRKNDMLQALDTQMDELSESVRREEAKARITNKIKEIRHDIQQNINEDEGWDKFEENFNLVYENFMQRLTARFPDLKLSDRKLCAYLRMGLSSKEMASLLNTSVRSIETARYRLRKKLDMEQGDNLTEFIQNF